MAVGKNRGQPVTAVPTKGYVEHRPLRQADLRDLDFRETLAVSGQFADALLGLVLEDENLLVFALAQDRAGHAGVGNRRGAERDGVAALAAQDDLVEGDLLSDFALEEIARNNVALGDLILLTASLDDRVHNFGRLTPGRDGCQRASTLPSAS